MCEAPPAPGRPVGSVIRFRNLKQGVNGMNGSKQQSADRPAGSAGLGSAPFPVSRLALDALDDSVPVARRQARLAVLSWGFGRDFAAVVELVASELVTNAVLASQALNTDPSSPICAWLRADGGQVTVAVWDASPELPVREADVPVDAEGGRGLALVEAVSERWGCTMTPHIGGSSSGPSSCWTLRNRRRSHAGTDSGGHGTAGCGQGNTHAAAPGTGRVRGIPAAGARTGSLTRGGSSAHRPGHKNRPHPAGTAARPPPPARLNAATPPAAASPAPAAHAASVRYRSMTASSLPPSVSPARTPALS
jgi:anti-sigma regulatory factor (Ser/Thr protein kinase)